MEINKIYKDSVSKKIIDLLFSENHKKQLKASAILNFIPCFNNPEILEAILLFIIAISWYEGFLRKFIPILGEMWVIPSLILVAVLFSAKKDSLSKSYVWYFSFLAISAISMLKASISGISPRIFLTGFFIFLQFGAVFFLSQSIKNPLNFFKKIIFISVPLFAVAFYQFFTKVKTPETWVSASEINISTRVFAFFGSPNVLGGVLSLIAILSFFVFIKEKMKTYLVFSLMSFIVVVLTFSRSAWAGLFAAAFITALLYRKRLIVYLPLSLVLLGFSKVRERIAVVFSLNYLNDASLDGRVWSFINGWHIFKNNFLLGTGPGTYGGEIAIKYASPVYLTGIQNGYTALYYTDNQWLEILVQTGILGFLAFLGFIIALLVILARRFKKNGDIMALAGVSSVICFSVMGFFVNVLDFGAVSILLGFIIGSLINEEKSSNFL